MNRVIIDCRKYGKQRRVFVSRDDFKGDGIPPAGMYVGKDTEGREAIIGEPSPSIYREVGKDQTGG